MRKQDGANSKVDWCKHSRNTARGKAGNNKSVRRHVRKALRKDEDTVSSNRLRYY